MYKKHVMFSFFTLVTCCLMGLLVACGQQPITNPDLGNNQITVQTVPMPATQTSCPTNDTARAAVIRPLALGKNQNLVYVYNEVPLNTTTAYGHLKRYDTITHQITNIVTSGTNIQSAEVSADGQWVMFVSTRLHVEMLQLVRMDGQGLQTLYCSDISDVISNAQWSRDQKSILVSSVSLAKSTRDIVTTTSTVTLLNVTTGTLHPEIKFSDSEWSGEDTYRVAFWLDNTRAYVVMTRDITIPYEVDLLNINANRHLNGADLTKEFDYSARMANFDMDSSYDGSNLFTAKCSMASDPIDTTISVGPATGGTQQTIYHQTSICSGFIRAISASQLLITVQTYNTTTHSFDRNQIWTMNTDGSGKKVLFSLSAGRDNLSLNHTSQYPWSSVSRDGHLYAIQSTNDDTKQSVVMIGALAGGAPVRIAATTGGYVELAGWTTM